LAGRELWGFWGRGGIAHLAAGVEGGRCYRQERTRRAFSGARMRAAGVGAAAGERLRRSRGHRVRAPACGWRRKRSALRGGKRGDCHEESILIGVGDGERAGRGRPVGMLHEEFDREIFPAPRLSFVRQAANLQHQMLREQLMQVGEEYRGNALQQFAFEVRSPKQRREVHPLGSQKDARFSERFHVLFRRDYAAHWGSGRHWCHPFQRS
jgi:hypothetical protein